MLRVDTHYRDQAQALFYQAKQLALSPATTPQQIRGLQAKIKKLFQEIHQAKAPDRDTVNVLKHARNVMILNTSGDPVLGPHFNRAKSIHFFANILSPRLPPAIMNSGYDDLQFPTVSTYQILGVPIAGYRLSPTCLPLIPSTIKKAVGKLDGRIVDLQCVTINNDFASSAAYIPQYPARPFNLNVHRWAYPDLLLHNDVKRQFPMGLFPIWGVSSAKDATTHKHPQPIAIGSLKPLNVHSHPRLKDKKPEYMLYSPDNAHFMVDPAAPFSATWAAVLDGDKRVLITRLMMINQWEDPFMKEIVKATNNCRDLDAHFVALSDGFHRATTNVFGPLMQALINDDQETIRQCLDILPAWYKNEIYLKASLIRDPSVKPSSTFGRNAFVKSKHLAKLHHLNKKERMDVLQQFIRQLYRVLIGDLNSLVDASTDFYGKPSKDAGVLMELARKIEDQDPSANKSFAALRTELKNKVFKAIWRLNGRKQKDFIQVGKRQFATSSPQERAKALYLAVNSLSFKSSELPKIKLQDLFIPPIQQNQVAQKPSTPNVPTSSASLKSRPVVKEKTAKSHTAKLQTILAVLNSLRPLKSEKRAKELHALFDRLGIDKETIKYEIYKDLGRQAGKKEQAAFDYGRSHFGHNVDQLKKALLKI